MCGYSEEARAYAKLVEKRSSGQQSQSLLERLQRVLTGENIALKFNHVNWSYGKEPRKQDHQSECDYRAKALKKIYGTPGPGAKPLILMDEPEQSLDARAEALLWKQIRAVDAGRVQVIVASHSLYPLLHPKAFNLIESVPGYIREVQTLTGA